MACALCVSNALRPVAFPLQLIGSCLLNRTLSAKLTFFFVTTVPEPPDLGLATNQIKMPASEFQYPVTQSVRTKSDPGSCFNGRSNAGKWSCSSTTIKKLMERGFHKPGDVEDRLGYHVGQLER